MNLAMMVYLASVSDSLSTGFSIFAIVFGIVAGVLWIGVFVEGASGDEDSSKKIKPYATLITVICFVMAIVAAVLPSQKIVYMMIGAEAATQVANNPQAQQILSNVEALVNKKLTEELKKPAN